MKKSVLFTAIGFVSLFGFAALPAHSLSSVFPRGLVPGHNHFIALLLALHPVAAAAWIITASRTLLLTVVPEPTSMLIIGAGLVGLSSLLRQRVKKAG